MCCRGGRRGKGSFERKKGVTEIDFVWCDAVWVCGVIVSLVFLEHFAEIYSVFCKTSFYL